MKKQIILLNGPSGSGKSTLAAALQTQISKKRGEKYEVVSIDDFMKCEPMETIYEDDVYEISGDLCQKVLEAMRSMDGVIIDHVITSERIFTQLTEAAGAYPLRTVHVTCSPEILRKREEERGDRCPGSAESSAKYLYPREGYELTVDTGEIPPDRNAAIILRELFSVKENAVKPNSEEYLRHYDSPLGRILLESDGEALTGLRFERQDPQGETAARPGWTEQLSVFTEAERWLDLYFSGKDPGFMPKIRLRGSAFRQAVWEILRTVPYGTTTTYGEIAERVAKQMHRSRMSAQAVGGAVGHNPVALIIPCHRVIGKNGSLTGYAGGLDRKKALLGMEKTN